jgi:hypothetical protein
MNMDKQSLAVMIPVLAVFFTGMVVMSRTLIGRAIARRIGGEAGTSGALEERVAQLESDLDAVRHELSQSQERIDFAERALAQVKEQRKLPGGAP